MSDLESKYAIKYEESCFGTRTDIDTARLLSLSKKYFERESDAEFLDYLVEQLVYSVISCAESEHSIDEKTWSGYSALMCFEALDMLDCENNEDFFRLARSCSSFSQANAEQYPELYDITSSQHKRLRHFVEDALEIE